jgi:hypothetical protein
MSGFEVMLTPGAQADIGRLEPLLQTRVLDKLEWMGENAELMRHLALRARRELYLAMAVVNTVE